MEIDTKRLRELCDQRDAIDAELQALFAGSRERKPQACGICGQTGHSARTCPSKEKS